jgi:hypothetical protein
MSVSTSSLTQLWDSYTSSPCSFTAPPVLRLLHSKLQEAVAVTPHLAITATSFSVRLPRKLQFVTVAELTEFFLLRKPDPSQLMTTRESVARSLVARDQPVCTIH